MREFQYCVPTRILFGPRTEEQAGQAALAAGGQRVLVLYGGGSCRWPGRVWRSPPKAVCGQIR